MYASVEMLLKFCAANFPSEFTSENPREKSGAAHTARSFKPKISHWLSRHFTHVACDDRIHSALVDSSTNKSLKFFARKFLRTQEGHETKTDDPMC